MSSNVYHILKFFILFYILDEGAHDLPLECVVCVEFISIAILMLQEGSINSNLGGRPKLSISYLSHKVVFTENF